MTDVDRMRWEAVRELERRGFAWRQGAWQAPPTSRHEPGVPLELIAAADAMHAELRGQIEDRVGRLESTDDVEMLERLADLADGYETVRPKV